MTSKINYQFSNPDLYRLALTHRSSSSEESNERLEFLGDSVLGMVITSHIFSTYPDLNEGELAKMRAEIVSSASLVKLAKDLDLGSSLILGNSEPNFPLHEKPSILADAVEALIAAIYLDGGLDTVKPLILDWFANFITEAAMNPGMSDNKTRLQELTEKLFHEAPVYEISSEGPDHDKFFFARVSVRGEELGDGKGSSKKEATQQAAQKAYEALQLQDV